MIGAFDISLWYFSFWKYEYFFSFDLCEEGGARVANGHAILNLRIPLESQHMKHGGCVFEEVFSQSRDIGVPQFRGVSFLRKRFCPHFWCETDKKTEAKSQ